MSGAVIQCFEHDPLSVGGKFQEHLFNALVSFNYRHGNRFFAIGNKRIKFRNYVGVIQVGNLTVEILPKLDRRSEDKAVMQRNLIAMLHRAGRLPLEEVGNASLSRTNGSLFELYLDLFLREVRQITRYGIAKRYSLVQGNERFLRGHMMMSQHLARNTFDKSRFYVEYQHYSKNHLLNRILKQTLRIISTMPIGAARDARDLLTFFDDVENTQILARDFNRIVYNRNTECYRTAIRIAELIISNHQPDLRNGNMSITSLLFDMNRLFELYVAHEIRRQAREEEIRIMLQPQKVFWQSDETGVHKTIRPDIVITKNGKKFILDTKWKLFDGETPSDADLKQLYAYSLQWNADRVILVYPSSGQEFHSSTGFFSASEGIHEKRPISIWEAPLLKRDKLNANLGRDILDRLISESSPAIP